MTRWALVVRDWSRSQTYGHYSIQTTQFNTRPPLHLSDDDLSCETSRVDSQGYYIERPLSEFTLLSYTVHVIKLAALARELLDLHNPSSHKNTAANSAQQDADMHSRMSEKYERFVTELPSHFRLGSTMGLNATGPPDGAIPVHRWMLHQQLWSLYLRLHRNGLSSQAGRASCQLLAQNIINTQTHIQNRCTICGSLSSSENQLFNAAVVLLIDLLFPSTSRDQELSSVQLQRLMKRDKVREAIELLDTESNIMTSQSREPDQSTQVKTSTQPSVATLEALMKLEEDESVNNEMTSAIPTVSNGSRSTTRKAKGSTRTSIATKIKDILAAARDATDNDAAATMETESPLSQPPSMSAGDPTSASVELSQDPNVLPILPGYLDSNFWQYWDLPPFEDVDGSQQYPMDWQTPQE